MCEDCDWPAFILCCCEIICVCCINCSDNSAPKYTNTQENNFTNPVNPNGTYIAQQPLNQGYPYSPQQFPSQQYSPQGYSPEQQFGAQQSPLVPNLGFNPSAPFSENNYYPSNQSSRGIASSNYPAPPPSYAEAVGMESYKGPSASSPDAHNAKA